MSQAEDTGLSGYGPSPLAELLPTLAAVQVLATKVVPCPGCGVSQTVHRAVGFPICKVCEKRWGPFPAEERIKIMHGKQPFADVMLARGKTRRSDVTEESLHVPAMFLNAKASPNVMDWTVGDRKTLVLYGPVGTGKTYQAAGALRAILERKTGHGYLINAASFGRLARAEFEVYTTCTALAIDDLGARLTPAAIATAYELIEARHSKLLPMVITTNLTPVTMATIDERIDSRLAAGLWLEMRGADRRLG